MGVTLTEAFEVPRPRLFRLAYRTLGSRAEAEDILQEAYLRWHQTERQAIESSDGLARDDYEQAGDRPAAPAEDGT